MSLTKTHIIVLLLFSCLHVNAQLTVNYHFSDTFPLKKKPATSVKSRQSFFKEAKQLQLQLIKEGFLTAGLDSFITDSNQIDAYFHIGKKYVLEHLSKGNVPEELLSEAGFRERVYLQKPFNGNALYNLMNKIITSLENNGYPFAQLMLDSVTFNENRISASLFLQKNNFYKIDSIRIRGYKNFPKIYLKRQLRIKEGMVYSEKEIAQIDNRLKQIPFLTTSKPTEILFTKDECKVTVFLKKKKSSKFDGIVGFLSDNQTGKLSFTGDMKLNLSNALKKGETINFNFKGMPNSTQKLIASTSIPYLFRSSFGVSGLFDLFKKDTTFIAVKTKLSLDYLLAGRQSFSIFIENKSTSLLAQNNLGNLTVLPDYADVTTKNAGISYQINRTDNITPTKGFRFQAEGSSGSKKIIQNPIIDSSLYQNIQLNSTVFNVKAKIEIYVPIYKRHILLIKNQSAQIINDQLFENELYRIGGFSILRGFNEEAIFASMYSVQTVEYHFMLEQNSYFMIFGDAAYYEKRIVNSFLHDTPYSFGAGITFETKAGVFQLIYALGSAQNNPIDLKGTKIHFGFVNFF